ncbi:ABC transporter substrate-binding protein [Flavisolibacter nicotianae]|uniref:ABC transporter substrate-binding protein n=1 Tax=Flavisolibacter nicotianae TaxID=2364882 RepID=UPI000EAB6AC0|nr:extracellular solute-binding protein [Flavisolibacter nicotianae]
MKEKIILKGITWGHSRGITPLLAYAQRFSELYPQVDVQWKKRTLQEFADFPIEQLTAHYDLLIIDHPWVGCAAATNCVLPLERYLSEAYLKDQQKNSVGGSHQSYRYNGHQWALAIDAATPVASYRTDLLQKHRVAVPTTWEEVLALAKDGKVAVPAIPIDLLMNFYTFCLAHGKEPFQNDEEVIDSETGLQALHSMQEFYSLVNKKMFGYNPIAVAEAMTKGDEFWYCPFAYGYSNYSRKGYAKHRLQYTDVVSFNGEKLRTTVGGTGLAVSAYSQHKEWALRFAKELVSPEVQATFYVQHGGQPGHLSAWKDEAANQLCSNYFTNVLPAMERGYIRPRYNGYLHFQDAAGHPIRRFLWHGGQPANVLKDLNRIYQQSLSLQPAKAAV